MVEVSMKKRLESIYRQYHHAAYLGTDPLCVVRQADGAAEREVVGLLAAVLSYGRVETIIRSVSLIMEVASNDLLTFLTDTTFSAKKRLLHGFKHRFNTGEDIARFLTVVAEIVKRHGTIESFFTSSDKQEIPDIRTALISFSERILTMTEKLTGSVSRSFCYLVPSPQRGSACKRLNMYLRWMVRADDGIDLGIWKMVLPAALVIPVDTHIARIALHLGMTCRATTDWIMAEEITAALRQIDPVDPVRFDFSLCRAGMVNFRRVTV